MDNNQLLTKDEFIKKVKELRDGGWHRSVKQTIDFRNDGAVGNTIEALLGITENNLPIPNMNEWELKGQRANSTSLITLKHIEPSPKAAKFVPQILLPYYGWPHKQAGKKYPESEMSFRSTTSALDYTNRGFRILIDRKLKKVRFIFDYKKASCDDPEIKKWIKSVKERIGLGPIEPEPYWGFTDLEYSIGGKIKNCFYIIADTKNVDDHEHFYFREMLMLSGFSFEKFLACLEKGKIVVDFDARTGHNHGTKFRMRQNNWAELYSEVNKIF